MRSYARLLVLPVLLAPSLVAGCGPQRVQLYEGAKLPDDQVTVMWSNPRLELGIDRQYQMPAGEIPKLHRFELPPGNHAVEVKCLYGDPQHPRSNLLEVELDGDAGHIYKPRVQFSRGDDGLPKCKVKMFDITSEPGGEKVNEF